MGYMYDRILYMYMCRRWDISYWILRTPWNGVLVIQANLGPRFGNPNDFLRWTEAWSGTRPQVGGCPRKDGSYYLLTFQKPDRKTSLFHGYINYTWPVSTSYAWFTGGYMLSPCVFSDGFQGGDLAKKTGDKPVDWELPRFMAEKMWKTPRIHWES